MNTYDMFREGGDENERKANIFSNNLRDHARWTWYKMDGG